MPYKKAVLEQDIEEERRMFYVGMTRARHRLSIVQYRSIMGKNQRFPVLSQKRGEQRQENRG